MSNIVKTYFVVMKIEVIRNCLFIFYKAMSHANGKKYKKMVESKFMISKTMPRGN